MRYWDKVIEKDLNYKDAKAYIEKYPGTSYITRPEWDGVHFISRRNKYCILSPEDGNVIEGAEEIDSIDKDDWMIVTIRKDTAVRLNLLQLIRGE